jgi:hypothetical protein
MRTNRRIRGVLLASPLCAIAGVASAQYAPPPPAPPPPQTYVAPPAPPPPTYVATTDPVYYNGQPTYWYQDHWYWRDAYGRWNYYRDEPPTLRDHRMHGPPTRHFEDPRGGRGDDHHEERGRR